jgi:predicted Zn-dependent peptidase
MPSRPFDTNDLPVISLFNEYFGGGMNSVVFQEIREFRSLGYSTYGSFSYDRFNRNPTYMYAFLGTQCDKTRDGVEAMRDLLVQFPDRSDKLAPAIEHQVVSRNSNHYTFRDLPQFVHQCIEDLGWQRDRRADVTQQISRLTLDDLKAFHAKYIQGRPLVVLISGNAKKYNPKEVAKLLGDNTPVVEYKYKQLFKF